MTFLRGMLRCAASRLCGGGSFRTSTYPQYATGYSASVSYPLTSSYSSSYLPTYGSSYSGGYSNPMPWSGGYSYAQPAYQSHNASSYYGSGHNYPKNNCNAGYGYGYNPGYANSYPMNYGSNPYASWNGAYVAPMEPIQNTCYAAPQVATAQMQMVQPMLGVNTRADAQANRIQGMFDMPKTYCPTWRQNLYSAFQDYRSASGEDQLTVQNNGSAYGLSQVNNTQMGLAIQGAQLAKTTDANGQSSLATVYGTGNQSIDINGNTFNASGASSMAAPFAGIR